MPSNHTGQFQSRNRKPRFIYHTPFSYLALMLAVLMIVPISGRINLVPDARADGANGTCQFICPPPDPNSSIQVCNADPNDPDCSSSIITTCLCNDRSAFDVTGDLSAAKCNADTTCGPHGGWVESLASTECACVDGSVYTFAEPSPAYSTCTSACQPNGGWI